MGPGRKGTGLWKGFMLRSSKILNNIRGRKRMKMQEFLRKKKQELKTEQGQWEAENPQEPANANKDLLKRMNVICTKAGNHMTVAPKSLLKQKVSKNGEPGYDIEHVQKELEDSIIRVRHAHKQRDEEYLGIKPKLKSNIKK